MSSATKLLWIWLNDNCDHAGVIVPDFELASLQIGQPVNEQNITELQGRLHQISPGKYIIRGFIEFQYGDISPNKPKSQMSRFHTLIWKTLKSHNIDYATIKSLNGQVCCSEPSGNLPIEPSEHLQNGSSEPTGKSKVKTGKGKGVGGKEKKENIVMKLVFAYQHAFQSKFGKPFAPTPRDWKSAKALLKRTKKTKSEIMDVVNLAWNQKGSSFFHCLNRSLDIIDLDANWNKIQAELGKSNSVPVPVVKPKAGPDYNF